MRQLEGENNRIFIEAYGLQDELTPDVPLTEITLTCNPYYRYGDKPAEQLADLQRTDTMRELLSYAVGCMMGRYSLDKPGLILANAGDGIAQYLQAVGLAAEQLRFAPDDDGVIPIVGDDGFSDDIVVRTRAFVQAAFGPSHLEQNVTFIEQSLGRALRDYYSKDFYKYHLQHYKNRPIYWMVSSPNGTFKALIYLHRYRRDTMSIVLKYVRQYRHTIESAIMTGDQQLLNPQLPKQERTTITKQLDTRRRQLAELKLFEGSVYDLASQQIAIDLDDGVKVNYRKFKEVLVRIPSLERNEE
jgi:type II restriction/modification system DNA methylase subunit YeeA